MQRVPLLLLLLAVACASAPPVHVVIVHTTDVHGWFAGHPDTVVGHYGGLATFASYVDALRAKNPGRVVLLDSGDLFQGTLESNIFEGEPVIKGYNALGYAATAVGNHEFDYGPIGPEVVAKKPGDDPLGALKRNVAAATFPFLAANMTEKGTGRTPSWAKRYVMLDVAGAKIGVIGLITPDTPNVTMPQNVQTLAFGDPVKAAIEAAAELRKQGADTIIAIAHMGGRCKDMNDPSDVASCEPDHEVMHFLEALPPGTIDLYLGGHTHAEMRQLVHGVPSTQALAYSRDFDTVDLTIDRAAHKTNVEMRPHTMICERVWAGTETCDSRQKPAGAALVPRVFEGKTIVPDAKVAAIFAPYLDRVAAKRNEPTGIRTSTPITRSNTKESALGDLIADTLREAMAADLGAINSGGIRADLPAGDLKYGDVFEVSPFDNYPAVVTLNGDQVAQMLRLLATGERGIMQVSGLRYTIDTTKKGLDRMTGATLENGQPLDPQKLYKVATVDFLAVGGDGLLPVISTLPPDRVQLRYDMPTVREVIIATVQKHPQPIAPPPGGRITVLP